MSHLFSDRVKQLNLPLSEFVIIGSGILDELGIRESNDIDLVASRSLFESLSDKQDWRKIEKFGRQVYVNNNVEAEAHLSWAVEGDGQTADFDTLMNDSVKINDINFMTVDFTYNWKKWYGRDKDLADLSLIDNYRRSENE